ncbi:recombinase family protein [Neorhodopirellula lusitana]|uniref:recombinase family protein n=1 Tax=Neorhodopirellula lusitana TaxID=445327 RepID=UPI00384B2510
MVRRLRKTAVYIRVSTSSQNEASQKAEILRWLQGHRITPKQVVWFVDKQIGDNLDRPAFKELQSEVFAGTIGMVVVYKLDRLSRKMTDGITTLSNWLDKGIRFVSVSQQFDFSGTVGKMIAGLLFGIAEMEQETRRERQAAGIKVAKKAGKYKGRKPGSVKANPARAKKLRDDGLTLREIGAALNVSHSTVIRYLA